MKNSQNEMKDGRKKKPSYYSRRKNDMLKQSSIAELEAELVAKTPNSDRISEQLSRFLGDGNGKRGTEKPIPSKKKKNAVLPKTEQKKPVMQKKKEQPKPNQPKTAKPKSNVKVGLTPGNGAFGPDGEKIKIIPLGGLGEIGKNMTVIEYKDEMIVIDCGLAFPEEDMPGVDLVIPDTSYLMKNKDKVHGIIITHGHEDHIGALPYVLKELNVPVYGTRLTLGIIEEKLKEFKLGDTKLVEVPIGGRIRFGSFEIELIRTNHSIADSVALAITTPAGVVIHTGDFKLDTTPIQGEMMDLTRLGELGKRGVLLLMSDSTNVERPGYAMSEKKVGGSLDAIFIKGASKRIIVTTFASNVARVQQIIDAAVLHGRKVAVVGRSMENIINVAIRLGYMEIPDGTLISIDNISNYPAEKIVIITTGSQGEPMSGLYRMAFSDHRKVEITYNDFIVMSSSTIPGNEKFVTRVINELFKSGAEVAYDSSDELHVSGHACREELKLMLALTRPRFFMPVHGEYRHLKKHAELAKSMGIPSNNIFILENGNTLEISPRSGKITSSVPSGKILIDGSGIGDVGSVVLRDRMHLAQDGLVVVVATFDENSNLVANPEIISRGFVYVKESDELINGAKAICMKTLEPYFNDRIVDWQSMKNDLNKALSSYFFEKTKRRPMILPIITVV